MMILSDDVFMTMTDAYPEIVKFVLENGDHVRVRDDLLTFEMIDVQFSIVDAVHGGAPVSVGRKLGRKMQLIDGLTNLSGESWPGLFLGIAPFLDKFADTLDYDDKPIVKMRSGALVGQRYFQGQYGPRLRYQLPKIIHELKRDPTSRRAIMNLWDPNTDFDKRYSDRPCVSQIQFLIRNGLLEMFVTMRSNDVWTGLAYDVFQMGQIQAAVSNVLGIHWGVYHHRAISLHIYESDIDKLTSMVPKHNPRETNGPDWRAAPQYESILELQKRFRQLCLIPRLFSPKNNVERWYRDELITALDGANNG